MGEHVDDLLEVEVHNQVQWEAEHTIKVTCTYCVIWHEAIDGVFPGHYFAIRIQASFEYYIFNLS